jgi:transposase
MRGKRSPYKIHTKEERELLTSEALKGEAKEVATKHGVNYSTVQTWVKNASKKQKPLPFTAQIERNHLVFDHRAEMIRKLKEENTALKYLLKTYLG